MNLTSKQIALETKYSKKNIRKIVRKEIESDTTTQLHFLECRENLLDWLSAPSEYATKDKRKEQFWTITIEDMHDVLIDIMVPLLADNDTKRLQALCGSTVPVLERYGLVDLDTRQLVTLATEIITVMAESELLDIHFDDFNNAYVSATFELDEFTYEYINQLMYVPPSIVQPLEVKSIHEDGSYTQVKPTCMLGHRLNIHSDTIALDVINLYARQKLVLDPFILSKEETPSKELDTLEKHQQFELMRSTSRRVYDDILEATEGTGEFYFRYAIDSRGRMYTCGYHINLQSTEYKKALVNFAEGELVNG